MPVTRDELISKLNSYDWPYSSADDLAKTEMARRIADVGRRGAPPITYSDLVRGISFKIPSVHGGQPFRLEEDDWIDLHRRILGDFLGAISADTYRLGAFWATCLVVSKTDHRPSASFFKWLVELGVLRNISDAAVNEFWAIEARRAYDWYASH